MINAENKNQLTISGFQIDSKKPPILNNLNYTNQDLIIDKQYAKVRKQSKIISQKNILSYVQNLLTNSSYRADIDGLRTIAISIVVIFHAWPQFMTGGFIGVDVFFVISGFLISGIIIKQVKKDSFSYLDFYSRRIKRINPALIFVQVLILIYGCLFLFSNPLYQMTQTMAYSSAFAVNIRFLQSKQNYFEPSTKQNPFLHLWSLGVEEQFYIVWPMFITLIIKCCEKKALYCMYIFTFVSFALQIALVYTNPDYAFYFPLARFWQMSIGGILAYHQFNIQKSWLSNLLSGLGTAGILIVIWIMREDDLVPGWWALIPTLGAAFILVAGKQAYINKRILSSSFFVFIGKISYPLYLWHWPLLVLSRVSYPQNSKSVMTNPFFIVFLAVLFSIVSYYLIENPIRHRKSGWVTVALFIIMSFLGIFTGIISTNPIPFTRYGKYQIDVINSDMFPTVADMYLKSGKALPNSSRNPNRSLPLVQHIYGSKFSKYDGAEKYPINPTSIYFDKLNGCVQRKYVLNEGSSNELFLVGDSHAMYTIMRYVQMYQQNKNAGTLSTFPTIVGLIRFAKPFISCNQEFACTMNYLRTRKPKRILFVNYWQNHLRFGDFGGPYHPSTECGHGFGSSSYHKNSFLDISTDIEEYKKAMQQLINLGIDVYVADFQIKEQLWNPIKLVDNDGIIIENLKPLIRSEWQNSVKFTKDLFDNAMNSIGAKLIDFTQGYCWLDLCYPTTPVGYPIYSDEHHQAGYFSRYWFKVVDFLTVFP